MLATIRHDGPGDAPPLVIAHGLFGSARNWGVIARRLAETRPVIAVDMRNHGDSPREPDHSYAALAADLAEVIASEGGTADLLGHSMGGKAAMVLALTEPARIRRLIVADIAPTAYSHSQMPVIEALRAVDLSRVARRTDADPMLAASLPDPGLRAFLLQSLAIHGDGDGTRWKLNLDALAGNMPEIMGFPDPDTHFDGPALFLRGGRSDYVPTDAEPVIRRLFPAARIETIGEAGHWLHAEAPRPFTAAVAAFLDEQG